MDIWIKRYAGCPCGPPGSAHVKLSNTILMRNRSSTFTLQSTLSHSYLLSFLYYRSLREREGESANNTQVTGKSWRNPNDCLPLLKLHQPVSIPQWHFWHQTEGLHTKSAISLCNTKLLHNTMSIASILNATASNTLGISCYCWIIDL